MKFAVPHAKYAFIGGSGTWGMKFPEDLNRDDVKLIDVFADGFDTPYGQSAAFKLLQIEGESVLRVAMHGRRYNQKGYPREPQWIVSQQVASVLKDAGVESVLVEASVGGIQSPNNPGEPLPPWSVVVNDDFMMLWSTPPVDPPLGGHRRVGRYQEPFCAGLREVLFNQVLKEKRLQPVFDHGVYACTPWGRFETPSEVRALATLGAHVVGQTLAHEVPLLRQLGIHVGSLSIVSNYAEGITGEWVGKSSKGLSEFYYKCAPIVGNVMVNTLKAVIENGRGSCNCDKYYLDNLNEFPVPGA